MSSREVNGAGVPSAPSDRAMPAWIELLVEMKSPSISLYRVYQRAGVSKSRRYWLAKVSDPRVSLAYRMARAAGIDPAKYLVALAERLGPKPLVPDRERAPMPRRRSRKACSLCRKPGHDRRTCTSSISSDALLLRARAAATVNAEKET